MSLPLTAGGFHQHGAQCCHGAGPAIKVRVVNEIKGSDRIRVACAVTVELAVREEEVGHDHNRCSDNDPHQEEVFGGRIAQESMDLLYSKASDLSLVCVCISGNGDRAIRLASTTSAGPVDSSSFHSMREIALRNKPNVRGTHYVHMGPFSCTCWRMALKSAA